MSGSIVHVSLLLTFCIFKGLINTFGVHLLKYINNVSVWWHALGTTAVIITILAKVSAKLTCFSKSNVLTLHLGTQTPVGVLCVYAVYRWDWRGRRGRVEQAGERALCCFDWAVDGAGEYNSGCPLVPTDWGPLRLLLVHSHRYVFALV